MPQHSPGRFIERRRGVLTAFFAYSNAVRTPRLRYVSNVWKLFDLCAKSVLAVGEGDFNEGDFAADFSTSVGWEFADFNLWWPQTEALYACLLAWHETGAAWALDWYRKIWNYCVENFYMPEIGEWRQKLTRDQQPFDAPVTFPVKDPFHLPRSLMLQIELLRRRSATTQASAIWCVTR